MKISNINNMPLYIPKIVDGIAGFAYKEFKDENSIFISDTIPLTSLFSDYLGKFRLSNKFNRTIYMEKYIKAGKYRYIRNFSILRRQLQKGLSIFTPNIDEADCIDLSLENITFRKAFGNYQSFKKISAYLSTNTFIHEKENQNVFWLLTNKNIDGRLELTDDDSDIDNYTLMLSRIHKEHPLNPLNNKHIKNIFIMIPFDADKDLNSVDLKFMLCRIYEHGKELNYSRIRTIITKMLSNTESLMGKKLFSAHVVKNNPEDNTKDNRIDPTFDIDKSEEDISPVNNITSKAKLNDTKKENKDNEKSDIKIIDVKTKDKSQVKILTQDQLKQTYLNEVYEKEISNMFESAIKNFNPHIELKSHTIEDADDGTTKQDKHTFHIIDPVNKADKKIDILIPKVIDKKFFEIYGKKYILANQVYSNLINKIKEDTIAFTSSFTKTMIYIQGKADDKIAKFLTKKNISFNNYTKYLVNENKNVPNSLHIIFKQAPIFQFKDYIISYDVYCANFKLDDITQVIGIEKSFYPKKEILSNKDSLHQYIKEIIASNGLKSVLVYNTRQDTINNLPFLLSLKDEFGKEDTSIKRMSVPGSSQYARMNIAGKKIPVIIAMLIYHLNQNPNDKLQDFFNKHFNNYVTITVSDSENEFGKDNVISLKLSDGYIYMSIYPGFIGNELLLSPIRKINMSNYSIENLQNNNDIRLLLIAFFEGMKITPDVAINSINSAISTIVDPITKEMIEKSNYTYYFDSKEVHPRNIIEILYYCVYLLNDRTFKNGNDFSGYRIRNMESIPAIIYKLISAKADLANKEHNSRLNNRRKMINAINIRPTEVLEEFRNLTTFETYSDLNISNEIGMTSKATYKGFAGLNNNRAVGADLRATDPSSIGFIDVGNNVDNANVGSNRMMPYNPNIKDIRGEKKIVENLREKVMNNEELTDEEMSSVLSFDTYIEPFVAAQADAPRISMTSIQARHGIPLDSYDDLPIKTGIEDSIKDVVSESFVIKSPDNEDKYKVFKIDDKNKNIILKGSSGKSYKVSYNDKVVNNSGGGFFHLKEFYPCVKEGQTIEKETPVALDKGSFKNDNYTNAKLLRATLLNFPETLEDGAILSESAAKDLVFNYVTEKSILIRSDQSVTKLIDEIGTEVGVGTPLVVFSQSDDEDDMDSIFGDLNQSIMDEDTDLKTYIKSKYKGKIVDIKIQYTDTSGSGKHKKDTDKYISKLIKKLPEENIQRLTTDRINGEIAPGAVLISYYILTKIPAMSGSKTTAQSTKSVFIVRPDDEMPRTLKGERIDYVFSIFSIISRMTINNFSQLYLNKCIIELREQLKKSLK